MYFYRFAADLSQDKLLCVAILVIMEDVFLHFFCFWNHNNKICRNPCYNGRCISTYVLRRFSDKQDIVAILVIMEDVFLRYLPKQAKELLEKMSQSLL